MHSTKPIVDEEHGARELELAQLFDSAVVGVERVDPVAGTVVWANRVQLDLLGYELPDYVGRSVVDFHADEAEGGDLLNRLRQGEPLREYPARLRHRDGGVRDVLICSTPVGAARGGHAPHVVCSVRNITAQKRVERILSTENAVVHVLAEAPSLQDAMPRVLEAVCLTSGWSWGAHWAIEGDDEPVLRCRGFWQRPGAAAPKLEAATRRLTLRRGTGLPGGVWASGRPAWIVDLAAHAQDDLMRRVEAASDGVRSAIAFPILGRDGRASGVLEFFSRQPRAPDRDLLGMVEAVGRHVGQYVERDHTRQELRGSEARNGAIVRAALDCIIAIDHRGRVLEWNPAAEHTFGYARDEAVGREMAGLIVPPALREQYRLGLARHLLTGGGSMLNRRIEIRAVRKDGSEFPIELAVTPIPGAGPPTFVGHARDLTERRRADETAASLRSVVQELLVASAIQESVLPKHVPRLPGIQIAGMVRAAAQCSGDFYDFLTPGGGRAAIALGDVSGHGLGPALIAAEAVTCLRTLSRMYGRADHLMTEANAILADATPATTFTTMILVVVDPVERSLTYTNAGHPTGLVVGADCRVKAELFSDNLPLGVSAQVVYETGGPIPLATGDLVLLVSDGMLEAWSPQGQPFGSARLRELACALQSESASGVIERLYETVRTFSGWAPQHDDMSAVAIKVQDP